MAKWGEGDPRWIVEERADATNVNNWHWTEKNATVWSKDKLTELLKGFKIEDDLCSCEITDLTKIEGEACANNRKAKLIFFYEWCIKAEWKGRLADSKTTYKGKVEIPNLSEENEPEDIDVIITSNSEKEEAYRVKQFMHKIGSVCIRDQLAKYIRDLKAEFSHGMILPSKTSSGNLKAMDAQPVNSKNEAKDQLNKTVTSTSSSANIGVKIQCTSIEDRVEFKCDAGDLYRVFIEKEMVQAFTGSDVQLEAEVGGKFVLFGGQVTGHFTQLVRNKSLQMEWRFKTWPQEHYSNVKLEFHERDDCTQLTLTQTGVPENDSERTKCGWRSHYWERIKRTFGFGSSLF